AGVGAWLGLPFTVCIVLAASLAAGLYALVLIVASGRLRESWVNVKILWLRLVAVGRYLGAEDTVEAEGKRPDRRRRLVPFAAMMLLAVVGILLWAWARGRA